MSEMEVEDTQATLNQDSSVCLGDGTTCVECGKVFTHPFYFSTHISSHTSEKGFVVIGQCALCGLVFSDADIFAAHLNSSQARLENQVAPPQEENAAAKDSSDVKTKVASRAASAVKKKPAEIKVEIIEQDDIKVENLSPSQPREAKPSSKDTIDSNDESRGKRKRKAPERYEIDSRPQLATSHVAAADPEVEAYLLSLKQMGLTVDPAAFSSGAKRRRKTSEGSGGKGRGRKEFIVVDDLGADCLLQHKPSPKYEYVDGYDSFDEEPEILPVSGKMTRGQRLQQRQERLSQGQGSGADKKPDIIKLEATINPENTDDHKGTTPPIDVDKQNKDTVTPPTSDTSTPAVKRAPPVSTASPVIKKEKPTVAAPSLAGNVSRGPQMSNPRGRGRGGAAQPNMGKLNPVRPNHAPPFGGRNNQYRAFSMPNTGSSNVYQPRSAVANNSGFRPMRFPQGQVRERKDTGKSPSLLNPEKSLEDIKKNSRENVEMMLQNVGMIAVTSSAMGHGKIFGSEKGSLYPPAKKMDSGNIRQPGDPYGGFMNKSFSSQKSLPSQQPGSYRGQARFGSGPRGRGAYAQPYRGAPAMQGSQGQGFSMGSQRGRGQQFSSSMRGSIRGRGSNTTTRGGVLSVNSMMRGSSRGRGSNLAGRGGLMSANNMIRGSSRGRGSNPAGRGGSMPANNMVRGSVRGRGFNTPGRGHVTPSTNPVRPLAQNRGGAGLASQLMKPAQASGDVIVIVDDDDVQEIAAGPSGSLPAGTGPAVSLSSSTAQGSKGEVTILDVDMDSLNSEIKVIEDKTQELSSPTVSVELQENTSIEQPALDDVGNDDEEINDSLKGGSEPLPADAEVKVTGGSEKITDDVDILPGEDIEGWKVCLAEESDSNEETPSPQPSSSKASNSTDLALTGSPDPGRLTTETAEPTLEDLSVKPSPCQSGGDISPKVQQCDSHPQGDAECQSVSAIEELKVDHADSESQSDVEQASEIMGHEKQDVGYVGVTPAVLPDQELVPHGSNESQDMKSDVVGPDASTLSGAFFYDVLQEFKQENKPSVLLTEDGLGEDNESADQSMQAVMTADTTILMSANDSATEGRNKPFILNGNGDSCVALSLDDAVLSDKETSYDSSIALSLQDDVLPIKESYNNSVVLSLEDAVLSEDTNYKPVSLLLDDAVQSDKGAGYNTSVALSLDDALLSDETGFIAAATGPADIKTAVEESSLTNTDFETSPEMSLPDNSLLVTDIKPALSCTFTNNDSSSEIDSLATPLESDKNLVNNLSHSHVTGRKSDYEKEPANSSNAVIPEENVDSAGDALSSNISSSHSYPTAAADCLRDDSNLLDIFTEIEKTCKEMEQTLDSDTDKKSLVLADKIEMSRVVPDFSEDSIVVKEETDLKEVLKVADKSNGVAIGESRSDDGVKESRTGDCRYSDMIYEKEVIDNGNISSIDEEHNKIELVKNEVVEDESGV